MATGGWSEVGESHERMGTRVMTTAYQNFAWGCCARCPGVFEAVSDDIPFAVIPQENSVYGHVTETYDALRSPKAGQSVFVRGELPLAIKHCLVVRQGVQLADVERVMSHEQVRSQRSQRPSC